MYNSFRASRHLLLVFAISLFFLQLVPLPAQTNLLLDYGERFSLVERENLRVYADNSYRGFLFREKRGYFRGVASSQQSTATTLKTSDGAGPAAALYSGEVYVVREMKREARLLEKPVDDVREIAFRLSENGYLQETQGAYPLRKGFPRFPDEEVKPGDSWKYPGEERYIDAKGNLVRGSFTCRYTYQGEDTYRERPVRVIDTEYVFSPVAGSSSAAGPWVSGKVSGTLLIFTDAEGGFFVRERLERHRKENGQQIRELGFRLTWSSGILPARLDSLEQRIVGVLRGGEGRSNAERGGAYRSAADKTASGTQNAGDPSAGADPGSGGGKPDAYAKDSSEPQESSGEGDRTAAAPEGGISVQRREEGLVLNLPNIHFVPDKAQVLPDERGRLDRLAELLRLAPDSTFMVKGHTADVGSKESQYELSVQRAQTIIEELGRRGMPKSRFLYRGLGGTEPVANNETEEGRAQNRRVEIIILDG